MVRWITHEIEKTITINKAGNLFFFLIRILGFDWAEIDTWQFKGFQK